MGESHLRNILTLWKGLGEFVHQIARIWKNMNFLDSGKSWQRDTKIGDSLLGMMDSFIYSVSDFCTPDPAGTVLNKAYISVFMKLMKINK